MGMGDLGAPGVGLDVSDRFGPARRKRSLSSSDLDLEARRVELPAPAAFVSAVMSAIADTTMDFIAREPAEAGRTTKAGFDAFWKGVAR